MNLSQRMVELTEKRQKLLKSKRETWQEYEKLSAEDRTSTDATEKRAEYDKISAEFNDSQDEFLAVQKDFVEGLALRDQELEQREIERDIRTGRIDESDPNAPQYENIDTKEADEKRHKEAFWDWIFNGKEARAENRQFLVERRQNFKRREEAKIEQRAGLSTAIASNVGGGNLIPRDLERQLIEEMKFTGPMVPGGGLCRDWQTEMGNTIDVPTVDDTDHTGNDKLTEAKRLDNSKDAANANVIGDEDVPDFRKVTFGASLIDSKFIKVTIEMLQDSGISGLAEYLAQAGGARLGRHINSRFTATATTGLVAKLGTGRANTSAAAAVITIDEIRKVFHKIDPAYRGAMNRGPSSGPGLTWMFNDSTLEYLSNLKMPKAGTVGQGYTTEQYAFAVNNDLANGVAGTLIGRPYAINQSMDSIATGKTALILGDFRYCWIRQAGPMTMIRTDERFIDRLLVAFVTYVRTDMQVVQANRFAMLTQK